MPSPESTLEYFFISPAPSVLSFYLEFCSASLSQGIMLLPLSFAALVAATGLLVTSASSCSTTLTQTNSAKPSIISGHRVTLGATGPTTPRSIQFDSNENLLVVQQGKGIINIAFQDNGWTCLSVKNVVENTGVSIAIVSSMRLSSRGLSTVRVPAAQPQHQAQSTRAPIGRRAIA